MFKSLLNATYKLYNARLFIGKVYLHSELRSEKFENGDIK